MSEKTQLLLESLRRTDSFILAADQKSSFCLAAGLAFLGIYSTLFYSVLSDEKTVIQPTLTCTILGLILIPWIMFFKYIQNVFSPNLKQSKTKSIISFSSIKSSHANLDEFKLTYRSLHDDNDFNCFTENDILENHWICSEICLDKMKNFKKGLYWLWLSLSSSILGLAILIFFSEYSDFVKLLEICK